jgi:hypothetical protein
MGLVLPHLSQQELLQLMVEVVEVAVVLEVKLLVAQVDLVVVEDKETVNQEEQETPQHHIHHHKEIQVELLVLDPVLVLVAAVVVLVEQEQQVDLELLVCRVVQGLKFLLHLEIPQLIMIQQISGILLVVEEALVMHQAVPEVLEVEVLVDLKHLFLEEME